MLNYLFKKIALILNLDLKHVLSGFSWLSLTQGIGVISSLAVTYFFANTLSAADFGIYKYVIGLGVVLASFSLTGIPQAILQATSKGYKNFLRETTLLTIMYGFCTTGIALIASGYYFYMQNTTLAVGCLLVAFTHPVVQLFSNVLAYQNGLEKFKTTALLSSSRALVVSIGSLLTLLFTDSLLILLGIFFLLQLLVAIGALFFLQPKPNQITPEQQFHEQLSFAKHTSLRNWFVIIANRLDSVLVFQNLGAVELAVYSIANLVPDQVRGVFDQLQSILLPRYSKHKTLSTIRTYIVLRSLQLLAIIVVVTILIIIVIPSLFAIVFPTYVGAAVYAQIIALSLPAAVTLIPLSALNAIQKEKELYIFQITASAIQIVLLIVLLFMYGLLGAIIAKITAQYIRMIMAYVLVFTAKE